MAIKIRQVTHTYSPGTPWEITALNGIDLTIKEGEVLGVIGGVGSGKSTLASLIAGLETPTAGSISIDGGKPRPGMNIGILFQQPEDFFFENTVFDDMALGLINQGIPEKEVAGRIGSTLNLLGLDRNILDMSPFQLSKGTQRLAAFASVLSMRTRYLILDEPTVNIDPKSSRKVLEVIRNIAGEVTVIYISHQIKEVAAVSNRMIMLDTGCVSFTGTTLEYLEWAFIEKKDYLPVVNRIMYDLRELGLDIDTGISSPNDAVLSIRRSLEDRG